MRVKGEILFPNNIRSLRLRKGITQAQLGRMLEPPVVVSTISKIESGERRLSNLQLASLASALECDSEDIPVLTGRDKASEVRRWQAAQQDTIRQSVESGAAAIGYVLAQLRKKHGKTMQQAATAIGVTISVYHRIEMASRMVQPGEIAALARFYGMPQSKLMKLLERRTEENLELLRKGTPPEQLLPRPPRALLKEDASWGRLGALERYAMRGSIRQVNTERAAPTLPLYGRNDTRKKDGARRFVIDREAAVDHVPVNELLRPGKNGFLVRNFSNRLGFMLRPGALAYVDPDTPAALGDVVFLVRRDGSADAAVLTGDGIGALKLKMYNPDEEMQIEDAGIAAIYRVGMLIFA